MLSVYPPMMIRELLIVCFDVLLGRSDQTVPQPVQEEADHIRDPCDEQYKLAELFAAPCSFQVPASEPNYGQADAQTNDVVFDKRGRDGRPRVSQAFQRHQD